jgi:hypothetical protein
MAAAFFECEGFEEVRVVPEEFAPGIDLVGLHLQSPFHK